MGYFDVASDPLSQAAERASICLFLRGDLKTAAHSVGLVMTETDLAHPAAKIPTLAPNWHWLAWVTRVGTQVVQSPGAGVSESVFLPIAWQTPVTDYPPGRVLSLDPYGTSNEKLVGALADRNFFPAAETPKPAQNWFRSETGEITIDGPTGRLVLDTPRTAGGYAPTGQVIDASRAGVRIAIEQADATVWVSALDRQPIAESRRLLVTHLTDLQNTGIRYAEPARQTLLDWGRLPHLVHAGKAEVSIRIQHPRQLRVWALATNGYRLKEVPARAGAGTLEFSLDVAGDSAAGALMLYEIATAQP
jgi:hypothetical protein